MSRSAKNILLNREGTDQTQRFIDALEPSSVKLIDLNLKEWMQFAYSFAKHVNYFDINSAEIPDDDWEEFFKNNEELESFLSDVQRGGNITPHLALFVSFVWLMEFPKKQFNSLTKRHLDFYYKDILKIEKLPASPDKVYVLFELAKKATQEKIFTKTELDGGKDNKGQKRIYETTQEIIANKASVAQLRSVYNDSENQKVKAAHTANSYDGEGADFPDDVQWWPFGYFEKEKEETGKDKEYTELRDAKLGFAISSNVLKLQEGERNVQIEIKFQNGVVIDTSIPIIDNIEIWCTGEKEWLGPFSAESNLENKKNPKYSTELTNKSLKLAFKIPREIESIVSYNPEFHGESFITNEPIYRVLIKTEKTSGYQLYKNLIGKEIRNIIINISVDGIKGLELENDIGVLNADKPFYPFGTQPVKGSSFYINYEELFDKKWKEFDVEIEWKNTPTSFVDLYYAYRKDLLYKASHSVYHSGMFLSEITGEVSKVKIDDIDDQNENRFYIDAMVNPTPENLIVSDNNYFNANIEIQHKRKWVSTKRGSHDNQTLFTKIGDEFTFDFTIENDNYETDGNKPLKISLNQSFLHELFPRTYALALSSKDENALIPNEPYTPMIGCISMNYTASAEIDINNVEHNSKNNNIKLFHEHPFGQTEEYPNLQKTTEYVENTNNIFVVPEYDKGGELYIGLENAEPLQTVSLLIQLLEGSENPERESFDEKEKIKWYVLSHNQWKSLDSDYMIVNETDNFQKSGIVKFIIPKEAVKGKRQLGSELIWIKARIDKEFDAVSKVTGIHAQAVMAKFRDNGNELFHLQNGLEAETISKLTHRVSSIKGIIQPYSSYGGKSEESDSAYYRRISERLRHKNRAISIWDYEHLILQQFPKIHKVKCLNHTSDDSFLAPGYVYIVVIPDIMNTNVFNIFQPMVSKATLNKIQKFVNNLNSLHVKAVVRNPNYEEVSTKLKVKFYKGYDEQYYLKMLNNDIIRLLSPWAFNKTSKIGFSTTLHRSTLIHYIEKLEYVDYVEDVVLKKNGVVNTLVSPANPKSILVSVRQHEIELSLSSCLK